MYVYTLDLYMVHATCISTFIEWFLLFNIRCMIISSWSNSRDDNGIGFSEYLPASPQIGRDWYKDKWVQDRFVKVVFENLDGFRASLGTTLSHFAPPWLCIILNKKIILVDFF